MAMLIVLHTNKPTMLLNKGGKRTLIIVLNLIKIDAGLGHQALMKIPKSFNPFSQVTWELWMLHID